MNRQVTDLIKSKGSQSHVDLVFTIAWQCVQWVVDVVGTPCGKSPVIDGILNKTNKLKILNSFCISEIAEVNSL